jgi:uncharacterized membrane protein YdfJ with MMPL/SSD domain
MATPARAPTRGEGLFGALGRGIVRHPWYPIVLWIVLLVLALPFLGRVGSVTTNSATTLPSTAPSAVAQAEIDRWFGNSSSGSDSLLLLTGSNLTGPVGQASQIALTRAIASDRNLTDVSSVASLYSSYQAYLNGTARIGLGAIAAATATTPVAPLPVAVNGSAQLLWGPPALFLRAWEGLVAGHPGTTPSTWNYPAYNATLAQLGGNASSNLVLTTFYAGPRGVPVPAPSGFNGSAACGTAPSTAENCSDGVARASLGAILPQLVPNPADRAVPAAVLAGLSIANFTAPAAQRAVAVDVLANSTGLPAPWVSDLWNAFPSGSASPAGLSAWTWGLVANGSLSTYPVPVPASIRSSFLDPAGDAALILISFSVPDSTTTAGGANPDFNDVDAIGRLVPTVLATTDPQHTIGYAQTGGAPLDETETQVLNSSLAILLPLTVLVLIGITMLYFRAPLTPAITFGGLGIAIVLGLGGVVLIGTFVTHVDPTALTLQNTFVLGVGTDYSIFLVARYREELWKGADPREAVVTTVTWAGQSIATSGATAVIATLALAFSGVALLSQWGMALSLAVLIAVLVSLTLVPALLTLVGPRAFWPMTGDRFAQMATATVKRRSEERTYFFRTARRVQRRPRTVVALVLIASIPLLFIALTAPISFDFFGQLPRGHPATDGLASLSNHFGAGRAFPMVVLVTFAAPLLVGAQPNATEFIDVNALEQSLAGLSGVAAVDSLTSPTGAPLPAWLSYPSDPPALQAQLQGLASQYIGSDQSTVWFTVYPTASGLSAAAVALLGPLRGTVNGFAADHPEVVGSAIGGGAAETSDIQQQTSLATERMALLVSLGLLLVLFVVLRSWIIPPMAVATIGLSIGWAWGVTNLVLGNLFGIPLFYFVPTVLFILILGLGIDYNIFLLTRVREERLHGRPASEATVHGLAATGGIITAAAIILASAFAILTTGSFLLLKAIGFAVATAVLLDAMVVRTYLVPAALFLLGERVWQLPGRRRRASAAPAPSTPEEGPTISPARGPPGPS